MILRTAAASPFGRKVKIVAHILGQAGQMTVVDADTMSETDSIRRENPLGKIPTLILDEGGTLFDSRVIVEYLDHRAGGGNLFPIVMEARFAALKLQALADGIADAALLRVYEGRWREAGKREPRWDDHQAGKIARGLASLEAAPPGGAVDIGHIALACALGYLDLRFEGSWRAAHPKLVLWLDGFAADVPAFEATRVKAA